MFVVNVEFAVEYTTEIAVKNFVFHQFIDMFLCKL
jgi:hypothetical protein